MPSPPFDKVLRYLFQACALEGDCDLPDRELLERFRLGRDENAFAFLVRRHGPVVFGVCKRLLGDAHEAEDAFQATFLVLVRRSGAIRRQESLASWLYGVARRIALRARTQLAARRQREREAASMRSEQSADVLTAQELHAALDDAVASLKEQYRLPILLCYLQSKTYDQAAAQIGCSKTTIARRLEKALELLRRNLHRQGIGFSAAAVGTALAEMAAAAPLPALLTIKTVKAAGLLAAGKEAASGISASVLALVEEALAGAIMVKGKWITAIVAAALVLGGASWAGYQGIAGPRQAASSEQELKPEAQAKEPEKKDLPGASGSKEPRVDSYGDPLPEGAVARLGTVRFRHEGSGGSYPQPALTFTENGKTLVGITDSGVLFWDAATGKERFRLAVRRPQHDSGMAVSSDGKILAIAERSLDDREAKVAIWDLPSGTKTRTLADGAATGAGRYIHHVGFSSDAKTLACDVGGRAVVFDTASGQVRASLAGQAPNGVARLALAPDGNTLAATIDMSLQLWDVATGKVIRTVHEVAASTNETRVKAIAFSPSGKLLACADSKRIFLYEVETGKSLRQFEQGVDGNDYDLLIFAAGESKLVSANWSTVHVWDVPTGKTLQKIPARGYSVTVSPDGSTIACIPPSRGSVRLFETATGKELFTHFQGHDSSVSSLAYSANGKTLASTVEFGPILVWNKASNQRAGILAGKARTLGFSSDGKHLVTTDYPDPKIRIWDVAARSEAHVITVPDSAFNSLAVFSRDGQKVYTLNRNSHDEERRYFLRHWDVATGKQEQMWPIPREIWPQSVSPDGKTVFGELDAGGKISVYAVESGRKRFFGAEGKHRNLSVKPSPDARVLASGMWGPNSDASVWDVVTGQEIYRLKGHEGSVSAIAWSPDGRLVASGDRRRESYDTVIATGKWPHWDVAQSVRLWDTATGKEVACFSAFKADVTALTFSPDGMELAAGLGNSTILIWDVAKAKRSLSPTPKLTHAELMSRWIELGEKNARRAHEALWSLVGAANESVVFLQERLKPIEPAQQATLQRWIADLNSDAFAVRQAASTELVAAGDLARLLIENALKENIALETRRRLEQILNLTSDVPAPEMVRAIRAIMVLERIGLPEARVVLETLAKGAPGARETEEAKASLDRLKQRAAPHSRSYHPPPIS